MRRSPPPLRVTSSPSAGLCAQTASSSHAHGVPETGLGTLRDTQRPKRSSPMNCLPGDRNPATGEAPPTQFLRRKTYELSNKL